VVAVFYSYIGIVKNHDSALVRLASMFDIWSGIIFAIMNGLVMASMGSCVAFLGIAFSLSILQFVYLLVVRPYTKAFDQWSTFARSFIQSIGAILSISGKYQNALNVIGVIMTLYMPLEYIISQVVRYEKETVKNDNLSSDEPMLQLL
jgi:hypothetical protein